MQDKKSPGTATNNLMGETMKNAFGLVIFLTLLGTLTGYANPQELENEHAAEKIVYVNATLVYSQWVAFPYPNGFVEAYEKDNGSVYIKESVLSGETIKEWSQMITLIGHKLLAKNPTVTPQLILSMLAKRYQQGCPDTFTSKGLGSFITNGHEAFVVFLGCGTVQNMPPASPWNQREETVIIAIKGSSDYYTIQWAERGPKIDHAPVFDEAKWMNRITQLKPIKICDRVPNESSPSPSCLNQK
ncbi:MAG: hypothetical protein WC836_14845 [Desulfobacula sp.]|jgi:hypothetical protein